MDLQIVIVFIVAVPIALFPFAFIWYLNMGGINTAVKEVRARRAVREKETKSIIN